nr:NADH dehydrogenase subunit 5 [Ceratosolen fusciceps]
MLLYYLSSLMFLIISIFCFFMSMMLLLIKYSMFMEWNICELNSTMIHMFIYVDWMSLMFMFIVMMISSSVMLYCTEYMSHDNYKDRFFYLVFFFIMCMLLVIFSPNMMTILIGWDGLGLISYMLVIYYNNPSSYKSGMLTVLMNRVGDVMIIMSISLMLMYGSWNFMNYNYMEWLILLLIIIAAFTKSAQFPFSAWLPAAMAAPTPVSSLVHSSTLVTAGVYLLIRFSYLMQFNIVLLEYIKITGLLTMFMAGISAIFENDLKKIIAFSTLSQLGLMMMIYGTKQFDLVFFHLIIHAIFKSMMFMCSGAIIHVMNDNQDIRVMGNVSKSMPLTMMIMMISTFSLCGLPYMSGFYSKDPILEYMMISENFTFINKIILDLSIMLTIIYSLRMIQYLSIKVNKFIPLKMWVESKTMNLSMLLLLLFSLFFGFSMKWLLFMNIENFFVSLWDKIYFMFMCLISIILSKLIFIYKFNFNKLLLYFIQKVWMGSEFFLLFMYYPMIFGKKFMNNYEKGWSDYLYKETLQNFSFFNLNKLLIINKANMIELILALMMIMILIIMII